MQFEREDCAGKVSRSLPLGGEILTLSALDLDAGSLVSYRVVTGNSDSCFYLDEASGVLTAKCDLGRLPVTRRTLNVTATDGQHFADVMPIQISLVETEGFRRDPSMRGRNTVFECRTTAVAARLAEVLQTAERSNARSGAAEWPRQSSRYTANLHYPVFQRLPRSFYVNETDPVGSFVFQVSAFVMFIQYSILLFMITLVSSIAHLCNKYLDKRRFECPLTYLLGSLTQMI